tara:strand:+ start:28771 stop:28896 length:126 start_codon:yes stop_codon:yes gene_type:complete
MIFSSSEKIIWREFNKKNCLGFEKLKIKLKNITHLIIFKLI